ncbi:MAG: ABC transporter substrate-binding protein [Acidimicrobiales bacterium]
MATAALLLAACGGGTTPTTTTAAPKGGATSTTSSSGGSTSTTASAAGTPVKGGALTIGGSADVDHLDTVSAYYTVSYMLERTFARQLVSYPASTNLTQANTLVPDVATQVPSTSNGGITNGGKTYTFHIRQGVMWDTSPPRQVTSQDFLREFKVMCNPSSPVGAPGYYTSTIVGFSSYCTAEGKIAATAAALQSFVGSHNISGISTPSSSTIVFHLTAPAGDFLNIVSLPFASARPVEYMKYVPDSAQFRQHTISDGPYKIVDYKAGQKIDLVRDPAWKQSSDPIRHQYVDTIQVTEGETATSVQQQMQAGTLDLAWDVPPPTEDLPSLYGNPNFGIYPSGAVDYMVFNLQSPNNGGALGKLKVRQAIEYAIDKTAVSQIYGGTKVAVPVSQILTSVDGGYQPFDLYKTNGSNGDPAKAKSLLAAAGYPNGITLNYVYRNAGNHPKVATSIQADLTKAGIKVKLVPATESAFYSQYLENPSNAKRGVWDIAAPGWVPDWYGANNGRSVIQPLFDGRTYGQNSTDYGDYNSPTTNKYIDQALASTSASQASAYWAKAMHQVMQDAVVIPLINTKIPLYHASAVQNTIYSPFSTNFDLTQVWLKGS